MLFRRILLAACLSCGVLMSCFQVQGTESSSIPVEDPQPAPVVLVVTGYSSTVNTIRVDSLKILATKASLFCTPKAASVTATYFPGKKIPQKTISEFYPHSKNKVLLCTLEELDPRLKVLAVEGKNIFQHDEGYFFYQGNTRSLFEKELSKITITGVTAITRSAGKVADAQGIDFLLEKLKGHFTKSDIVHMSNEVSLCDTCQYVGKTMKFCMKEAHASVFKTLGADVVELSGNHNLDYGKTWYLKSLDWYQQQGIQVVGGGRSPEAAAQPLVLILKDGTKLGWMAYNENCPLSECADQTMGANRYSTEKARKAVEWLKSQQVSTIVCGMQFGEWDQYAPHAGQVKISRELIDMGVDLVYGTANHQIQQIEFYKGKSIYYGLGNFLFDQIHRIGVRQAFFLHVYIYKGKICSVVPVYTFMEQNRQNRPATEAEISEMKSHILNDNLLYK